MFLWAFLLNLGIYIVTLVGILAIGTWAVRFNIRFFGVDEATVRAEMLRYVATYKLLITVFFFVPWLALVIIA